MSGGNGVYWEEEGRGYTTYVFKYLHRIEILHLVMQIFVASFAPPHLKKYVLLSVDHTEEMCIIISPP